MQNRECGVFLSRYLDNRNNFIKIPNKLRFSLISIFFMCFFFLKRQNKKQLISEHSFRMRYLHDRFAFCKLKPSRNFFLIKHEIQTYAL